MNSSRRLVFAIIGALMLSSCASSQMVSYTFPGIDVEGDLTVDDVRQIMTIARTRSDIRTPITDIKVTSPGLVEITAGKAEKSFDKVTVFKVRKENGRWKIVAGSVYDTEVVITS
jgi:hypothetical protein